MSNTKESIALFEKSFVSKNSGYMSVYLFEDNGLKHEVLVGGKSDFLKKGDTVLIKYSLEDPSIAEVIDFCYMKKNIGKAYCKCHQN